MYQHLFQPGHIGSLEVRNRIVMAPIVTWSAPEARVTDAQVAFYRERARGGVGLVIVQATSVLPEARPTKDWLGIWDDDFIPGLAGLVRAVQEEGAQVAIQLHHGGMRAAQPVGPSAGASLQPGTVPRELSREEITSIVEAFAQAAVRAREAGFDAIEVHGAHGYVLNNFLSPITNRRQDEYGGSVVNRTRFPCEVIRRIRGVLGPDFPIVFRMNGMDFALGGITLEDAVDQAPLLQEAGASALHISAGTPARLSLTYLSPQGALVPLAAAIRKAARVPVIAVGKISDPTFAEALLAQGQADFVALGRALLADPEWPRKARDGRPEAIRRCIYCNMCHVFGGWESAKYPWVSCSINPSLAATWRGEDYHTLPPAAAPKRVTVVGGGLAGMHAATLLAKRGHQVTLYEASGELGGQWRIGAQQDYKKDSNFGTLLEQTVAELKASGARVVLRRSATPDQVRAERPDAVVVSTGARPAAPSLPGVDRPEVVHANDVLVGQAEVRQPAIVVGAGYVGMETALHLAERGKRVYLLTRSQMGRRVGRDLREMLVHRLVEAGVYQLPHSPVVEIVEGGVKYSSDGEYRYLRGSTVVLACGAESERALARELEGTVPEIHTIGDAVEPRDAFSAFDEAEELARRL